MDKKTKKELTRMIQLEIEDADRFPTAEVFVAQLVRLIERGFVVELRS